MLYVVWPVSSAALHTVMLGDLHNAEEKTRAHFPTEEVPCDIVSLSVAQLSSGLLVLWATQFFGVLVASGGDVVPLTRHFVLSFFFLSVDMGTIC